MAEGHGAQDGDGHAQAAVAEAFVDGFGLVDGAEDGVLLGAAVGGHGGGDSGRCLRGIGEKSRLQRRGD